MTEYIKKEEVDKVFQLRVADKELWAEAEIQVAEWLKAEIDEIQSADVQPVKRGKFEERIGYGGWGDTYYHCSVCGSDWVFEEGTPKANEWNFCPHCGADMRGDENA